MLKQSTQANQPQRDSLSLLEVMDWVACTEFVHAGLCGRRQLEVQSTRHMLDKFATLADILSHADFDIRRS